MSVEYITKAWKFSCQNHTEKLVLISLCDNATDEGFCWPSHDTVAQRCDLTRRGVIKVIHRLIEGGVISVENRTYTSNMYRLFPQKGGGSEQGSLVNGVHQGSEQGSQGVVNGVHNNRHLNRHRTVSTYLAVSLRIYDEYPRKVAKPKALESIQKAIQRGADPDALIDMTKQYALAVSKWPQEERKFIPHATTWFNQERFNDDPETWVKEPPKIKEEITPNDRYTDHLIEQMRKI